MYTNNLLKEIKKRFCLYLFSIDSDVLGKRERYCISKKRCNYLNTIFRCAASPSPTFSRSLQPTPANFSQTVFRLSSVVDPLPLQHIPHLQMVQQITKYIQFFVFLFSVYISESNISITGKWTDRLA